ncbi:MAG: peroxiredoxin family protein [Bacteroidota bacterium]
MTHALLWILAATAVIAVIYMAFDTGTGNPRTATDVTNSGLVSETLGTALEGQPAPDFVLPHTQNRKIKLSDYRGKVVIVDFWATWCPPCRAEIPGFIDLYSKYKDKGFVMLGISLDEGGLSDVVPFVKQYKMNYPVLIGNSQVVAAYGGIRGIPTTFIIDKKGMIRARFEGYRPKATFENLITKLLAEK